jgi:exodeoxyribonuclease V alpha subunit
MSTLLALWHGGHLRAVDHALALALARARPETPDAVQVAAALASRALADGHARVPMAEAATWLGATETPDEAATVPPLPDPAEWRALLAASPWVHVAGGGDARAASPPDRVLVLEDGTIALRRYRECEVRLATALRARAAGGDGRLHLLTGGPGTGKTTQVARALVDALRARRAAGNTTPLRVALAAPTGKAAARLAEAVRSALATGDGGLDAIDARALAGGASTLHRLLGWRGDGTFRHGPGRPVAADWVVVDEASMVDLPLMAALVEAVRDDAALWLVGDPDQLPAVEAGDVLAALAEASSLPDAPLAPHRTHLVRVHRQAPELAVAPLAQRVRLGEVDALLEDLAEARFAGVQWRPDGDRALADAVRDLAVPEFRALAACADPAAALAQAQAFRLLCAVREGAAGSRTLNALVGQALDPLHGGAGWFRGRLLMVTENSPRQGLFNGDIGLVWPDDDGTPHAWFEGETGLRAWAPGALPAHAPAYALTVHKAQGSEFERVWLALPERGARVLSRELLYTGLTRARRGLALWATEAALRQAIDRRTQRWSGLAGRLSGP